MNVRLASFALAIGLVALPSAASAQTTRCAQIGIFSECRTDPPVSSAPPAPVDFAGQLGPLPDYEKAAAAGRARGLRIRAGKLIAAGQCQQAFDEALSAGDLALAREIKGICTP